MLIGDKEILEARKKGDIVIENFSEECLEPASYDMRLGNEALVSHQEKKIDVSKEGNVTIKPGEFGLLTTYEKIKMSNQMVGSIGLRSHYARKGLVLLAGPQIDPGFEGVLVLGAYNASPRKITIDYLDKFCTVEFHKLSKPVKKPYRGSEEQKKGLIPEVDKSYLRTLETESLSDLSESVRQLSENVSTLTTITYKVILPILVAIFAASIISIVVRGF